MSQTGCIPAAAISAYGIKYAFSLPAAVRAVSESLRPQEPLNNALFRMKKNSIPKTNRAALCTTFSAFFCNHAP